MRLAIVIPAYNEARVIGKVIRAIPRQLPTVGQPLVIVIDDGSNDGTGKVAEKAGAIVLRHRLNRGKGVALSTGLQAAQLLKASLVVTLDADGQHDPAEIPKLLEPILQGGADVVIGSRLLASHGGMPLDRLANNKISNIVTRLVSGVSVSDSQSGFRVFSRKALRHIVLSSRGFEVETEMLAEANRHHLAIHEVPIRTIYTTYSRSKGQRFTHGIVMAFQLMLRAFRGYR